MFGQRRCGRSTRRGICGPRCINLHKRGKPFLLATGHDGEDRVARALGFASAFETSDLVDAVRRMVAECPTPLSIRRQRRSRAVRRQRAGGPNRCPLSAFDHVAPVAMLARPVVLSKHAADAAERTRRRHDYSKIAQRVRLCGHGLYQLPFRAYPRPRPRFS